MARRSSCAAGARPAAKLGREGFSAVSPRRSPRFQEQAATARRIEAAYSDTFDQAEWSAESGNPSVLTPPLPPHVAHRQLAPSPRGRASGRRAKGVPQRAEPDRASTLRRGATTPAGATKSADVVILLCNGEPVLGIVVEVQLLPDARKRFTWPAYVTGLRARFECPSCLLS